MHVELGFLILFGPEKGYITGYYMMSPESSNSEFPFQPNNYYFIGPVADIFSRYRSTYRILSTHVLSWFAQCLKFESA